MHAAPEADLDPGARCEAGRPPNWAVRDRSLAPPCDRSAVELAWKRFERAGRRHGLARLRALRGNCDDRIGRCIGRIERLVCDHSFLRTLYPNRHEITPGVFRSAQPSPRHIAEAARRGVRTVVNLRGERDCASYLAARAACDRHGIALVDFPLQSRQPPRADRLLALCDVFATARHPILLHCKSGADRAGLASAVYLLDRLSVPAERARRQLSWRYGHVAWSRTGVLGAVIDAYAAAHRAHGVPFRDWLARDYDPEGLLHAFRTNRLAAYIADRLLRRE